MRAIKTSGWVLVLVAAAGCAAGGGMRDAGRDSGTRDSGTRDAQPAMDAWMMDEDAGTDAGAEDASLDALVPLDAPVDAFVPRDSGSDAGTTDSGTRDSGMPVDSGMLAPPTVDGTLSAGEWDGAALATNTTPTAWTGTEIRSLRATVRGGALYVAVELSIQAASNNGVVVFVDRDLDAADGFANMALLTDGAGALDNAISPGPSTTYTLSVTGLRPDFAWATLDLARSVTTSEDRMGWRDLVGSVSGADLAWVVEAATNQTSCSATVCETRITTARLGAVGRIGLFARVVNSDGTMSPNQTAPMDMPAAPRTVSMILEPM